MTKTDITDVEDDEEYIDAELNQVMTHPTVELLRYSKKEHSWVNDALKKCEDDTQSEEKPIKL